MQITAERTAVATEGRRESSSNDKSAYRGATVSSSSTRFEVQYNFPRQNLSEVCSNPASDSLASVGILADTVFYVKLL